MITLKNTFTIVLFGLFFQSGNAQYITVDESFSALDLVEDKLINSSCANVFNVSVSGGNFASGEKSYGYFDASGTGFPFENGIILSTGKINNAPGPNTFISDDGNGMGWTGDTDLNQALNISNSINATVLEFDFIPLGNFISFDYIFSSEEYHGTATCQYSDGFAFLLKEASGSTYQNLAVLPGTSIPVKVTSVHPAIAGGCAAQNEQYFDAFNGTNHPTNYNGQTVVLTAQADVIPGTTYHIKLVIADEGNYRYDSAIFLGGGSFDFGIDIGDDRLIATGNPLCPSENLVVDATQTGATAYQWYQNNVALPSETNATYNITAAGDYSVEVNYGVSCQTIGDIKIEYATNLIVNQTTFPKCDADANQDGITQFDLNALLPDLFTNLPANYTISFFDATTSTTALPSNYTNITAFNQTIYARITNIQSCYSDYPVHLVVNTFSENVIDETVSLCENQPIILDAGSGFLSYSWNTNPVQTSQTISVDSAGTYIVTLTNGSNCSKTKTFTVTASGIATIEDIIINDFQENNSATIQISTASLGIYEFSLDGINYQNSNIFSNLSEGDYTVYVNDTKGCGEIFQSFTILDYPKFFTPNGDGFNDFWFIKNLNKRNLQQSTLSIFDRYGKFVYQINYENSVWDGTINGNNLPSSDYWFVIELTNGKTVKGHFTLKR
jgi:gliding motility-associated-like protein